MSVIFANIKSVLFYTKRIFSISRPSFLKIAQFVYKEDPFCLRVGYLDKGQLVDINKVNDKIPRSLIEILSYGLLSDVKKLSSSKQEYVPFSNVILKAPITGMEKILCVGLNYMDLIQEQNMELPCVPMIFSKFPSTIIGPSDPLLIRTYVTQEVDWEVELVVVIGRHACNVQASEAHCYIAGYTLAQDISARDWQREKNAGQFLLGKSMDTFCPLGPYVVTTDEIKDPNNLNIGCAVNNNIKQQSNTKYLIHKIPCIIERLTSVMTLLPGDIILTGSPGGTGQSRKPPEYLKPGDILLSELECVGQLTTRVLEF